MKTRSAKRSTEESCLLKRSRTTTDSAFASYEKINATSGTSRSVKHDSPNINLIDVTKNSRKRTRSHNITYRAKKAATDHQEEAEQVSKDDHLTNVLCKPLSVVLEPLDLKQMCKLPAEATNSNNKKSVNNYTGRDVKVTYKSSVLNTKSLNSSSAENQDNWTTGSMDCRSRKRCLQKSIHHNGKELQNSDQMTVTSQSLSHDGDQGILKSSSHQSRRELWEASHERKTKILRERRKVYRKPVCLCCAEKDIDNGNETSPASAGLKDKDNKHIEKSARTSDTNRATSSCQNRKNTGGASPSREEDRRVNANCQCGDKPIVTEHNTEISETTTTVKAVSEGCEDSQLARDREIMICHSDSNSAIPTSCGIDTTPLQARDNTSSQPASVVSHIKVHPQLHRRSASTPPQLQLGVSFRTAASTFMRLLQDTAAHLQGRANRVCDMLSDSYFQRMLADISPSVPRCKCHSPIGCFLTSIHFMNILKGRESTEFDVTSQSVCLKEEPEIKEEAETSESDSELQFTERY